MITTYKGTVYPWHCDHMGHMNVKYYAEKFDEATWHFFSNISITPEYIKKNKRGMVAVEQKTKYKNEVMPGDCIVISSEIVEMNHKTIRFKHTMKDVNTEKILAETEFLGVHLDLEKRKSCEFHEGIHQAAQQLMSNQSAC